jgi:hypothetical protein
MKSSTGTSVSPRETFPGQCHQASIALRVKYDPPFHFRTIVTLRRIDTGKLGFHSGNFQKRDNPIGQTGRPPTLPSHAVDGIVEVVTASCRQGRPLYLSQIRGLILEKLDIVGLKDTSDRTLKRETRIDSVDGIPRENRRMVLSVQYISLISSDAPRERPLRPVISSLT